MCESHIIIVQFAMNIDKQTYQSIYNGNIFISCVGSWENFSIQTQMIAQSTSSWGGGGGGLQTYMFVPHLKEHYIRIILSYVSTLAVAAFRILGGKT